MTIPYSSRSLWCNGCNPEPYYNINSSRKFMMYLWQPSKFWTCNGDGHGSDSSAPFSSCSNNIHGPPERGNERCVMDTPITKGHPTKYSDVIENGSITNWIFQMCFYVMLKSDGTNPEGNHGEVVGPPFQEHICLSLSPIHVRAHMPMSTYPNIQ